MTGRLEAFMCPVCSRTYSKRKKIRKRKVDKATAEAFNWILKQKGRCLRLQPGAFVCGSCWLIKLNVREVKESNDSTDDEEEILSEFEENDEETRSCEDISMPSRSISDASNMSIDSVETPGQSSSSGLRRVKSVIGNENDEYVPYFGFETSNSESEQNESDDAIDMDAYGIEEENQVNKAFIVTAPPNNGVNCFICKKTEERLRIPSIAAAFLFIEKKIFLPSECRVCASHLIDTRQRFSEEGMREITNLSTLKPYSLSVQEIQKLLDVLAGMASKPRIDFTETGYTKDFDYATLTGLTKSQFGELHSILKPKLGKSRVFSSETALALALTKLHTGISHRLLSLLFGTCIATSARTFMRICKLIHEQFVPLHLGYQHITREDYIKHHHTVLANRICECDGTQVIIIMDGTYFFCGKSSNFKLQRKLFSVQKGSPLSKAMVVSSPSGYILAVVGMYLSNGKNNDASITKHMFSEKTGGLLSFLKANDIVIWDRGFRDVNAAAQGFGLQTRMPHYLTKGAKQHSTLEANDSRLTTCLRWVVESVNSRLKRHWKFLDGRIENKYLPSLQMYVEVCAALTNAFCPPLATNKPEHLRMADEMLARKFLSNAIKDGLDDGTIVGVSKRSKWELLEDSAVSDFPFLTLDDLRNITFGVYQIKCALGYAAEHINEEGKYMVKYQKLNLGDSANEKLLGVKLESRHVSSAKYDVYVKYKPVSNMDASNASYILGWYCTCKAGARVVGCCAHVCSVLYHLGFRRYDPTWKPPANSIGSNLKDASLREVSSENEEPTSSAGRGGRGRPTTNKAPGRGRSRGRGRGRSSGKSYDLYSSDSSEGPSTSSATRGGRGRSGRPATNKTLDRGMSRCKERGRGRGKGRGRGRGKSSDLSDATEESRSLEHITSE